MILLLLTILLILLCPSGLLCDVKYSPDICHSPSLQNESIYLWVNSAESWQLWQPRPGMVRGRLPSQALLLISFPFIFHPGRRRLGGGGGLSSICNIIFYYYTHHRAVFSNQVKTVFSNYRLSTQTLILPRWSPAMSQGTVFPVRLKIESTLSLALPWDCPWHCVAWLGPELSTMFPRTVLWPV